MAEIVRRDSTHAPECGTHDAGEVAACEVARVERVPRPVREHERRVAEHVRATGGEYLAEPARKLDHPSAAGLRRTHAAEVVDAALDPCGSAVEVHVGPAQRDALPDSAAGVGQEEHERECAREVGSRRAEERVQLTRRHHALARERPDSGPAALAAELLPVGDSVARHQLLRLGVEQDAPQRTEHDLQRSRRARLPGFDALVVEALNVSDADLSHVQRAEEGHQVDPQRVLALPHGVGRERALGLALARKDNLGAEPAGREVPEQDRRIFGRLPVVVLAEHELRLHLLRDLGGNALVATDALLPALPEVVHDHPPRAAVETDLRAHRLLLPAARHVLAHRFTHQLSRADALALGERHECVEVFLRESHREIAGLLEEPGPTRSGPRPAP